MFNISSTRLFYWVALTMSAGLTTACNESGFTQSESLAQKTGGIPTGNSDPEKVLCDPFDPSNKGDPRLGIKASLSYIENFVVGGPYPVTSCSEFSRKAAKVDAEIYLGDLNITPRNFTAGFSLESRNLIKKTDGSPLVEWFMLEGETRLQLSPNQEEGYYQLAAISDDGVVIQLGDSNGQWNSVIDNQSPHSATMNCATTSLLLTHGQSIPMRFSYYQGPRVRIAMMLLWRKVSDSVAEKDLECEKSRNDDYFFIGSTIPSTPLTPYQNLIARGWSPLKSENFLLANGVNKCAESGS